MTAPTPLPDPDIPAVAPVTLRFVRIAAAALALVSILLVVWVGVSRISYSFELEWLEGTMADHVTRLVRGEGIYVPPSADFVPFIYPPLYYYVSAAVGYVTGPGLFPMRLVAFVSTLACFGMIGYIVRRETRSTFAAVVAAGLFAAAFVPGGAWFDLARVDSFFILQILVAAALVRFGTGWVSAAAAGLVMALALLTKQSAIMLGAPLGLYLLIYNRPRAFVLLAAFAIPALASFLALNASTDGWYGWYVWEAPARHSYILPAIYSFWAWSLFRAFPIALLAALWYLLSSPRRANPQLVFHGLLGAAFIGASWLHRVHKGGYENVLLLAYVALAILAGLAIGGLRRLDRDSPRVVLMVYAAVCVQLVALTYDPRNYIPGEAQGNAWWRVVDHAKLAAGSAWFPMHGNLTTSVGGSTGAHLEAVYAVQMTGDSAVAATMRNSIVGALERRQYAVIVGDRSMRDFAKAEGLQWFLDALDRNYVAADTIDAPDELLMPFTGARTRPETVYRPAPSP